VAAIAASLLAMASVALRRDRPTRLLAATAPTFLLFVFGLAVVVRAAVDHGVGERAAELVPAGASFSTLLVIVLVATVFANVVNNLPATLLLLAAIGTTGPGTPARLLALLVGVNIGPNLTYTGSLATLLWRRIVRSAATEPSRRAFFRAAWIATPPALLLATVALWCTLRAVPV